jgi:hypothetical protein
MLFFKGYKSRKKLKKEIEELKIALEKEQESTFEEYFNKNTNISTTDGLAVNFKGKELVQILASNFWDLVKDSDNYVVCDLNSTDGHSVEVTIKKKGKLSPQDKLKKAEYLLNKLLTECDTESDTAFEVYDYLAKEEELRKKYDDKK